MLSASEICLREQLIYRFAEYHFCRGCFGLVFKPKYLEN